MVVVAELATADNLVVNGHHHITKVSDMDLESQSHQINVLMGNGTTGGSVPVALSSQQENGSGASSTLVAKYALRLLMSGKEVGCLIGKQGDTVKKFREESGARINISDGTTLERIVTLSGAYDTLQRALLLITAKLMEDLSPADHQHPYNHVQLGGVMVPLGVPTLASSGLHHLKLIIPASQCGCLLGRAGAKIKELKEQTGGIVEVSEHMLPNSTERLVTVAGANPPAIAHCSAKIAALMLENTCNQQGTTIPYRVRQQTTVLSYQQPLFAPAVPASAAAATVQPATPIQSAVPAATLLNPQSGQQVTNPLSIPSSQPAAAQVPAPVQAVPTQQQVAQNLVQQQQQMQAAQLMGATSINQTLIPATLGGLQTSAYTMGDGPAAAAATNLGQLQNQQQLLQQAILSPMSPTATVYPNAAVSPIAISPPTQAGLIASDPINLLYPILGSIDPYRLLSCQEVTKTMEIPNELIGCVIGRQGVKIQEIRTNSGATIKISNIEQADRDNMVEGQKRIVTISGPSFCVEVAYSMINDAITLHKALNPTLNQYQVRVLSGGNGGGGGGGVGGGGSGGGSSSSETDQRAQATNPMLIKIPTLPTMLSPVPTSSLQPAALATNYQLAGPVNGVPSGLQPVMVTPGPPPPPPPAGAAGGYYVTTAAQLPPGAAFGYPATTAPLPQHINMAGPASSMPCAMPMSSAAHPTGNGMQPVSTLHQTPMRPAHNGTKQDNKTRYSPY